MGSIEVQNTFINSWNCISYQLFSHLNNWAEVAKNCKSPTVELMCFHWYGKHTCEEFMQVLHLSRDTEICSGLPLCKTISMFPGTTQGVHWGCAWAFVLWAGSAVAAASSWPFHTTLWWHWAQTALQLICQWPKTENWCWEESASTKRKPWENLMQNSQLLIFVLQRFQSPLTKADGYIDSFKISVSFYCWKLHQELKLQG